MWQVLSMSDIRKNDFQIPAFEGGLCALNRSQLILNREVEVV